jgi:4-amino-4-deoxy-L-arabinose transferase-like glycosyltransferase
MLRITTDGPTSESNMAAPRVLSSPAIFIASLSRLPAGVAVALLWALLFLPFAGMRALYYEEGRYTLAALDMLAHGHWLRPEVLGVGFVEKPPLPYWLSAISIWIMGGASEWAVRLPPLLATLLGALLVERVARREAGPLAGFIASIAFLVSPFVFTKGARGEPDLLVTVLSFAAFMIWLEARESAGSARLRGWAIAGLLLMATALCKGPQPLAYFGIGAGLLALSDRRWRELPELAALGLLSIGAVALWSALVFEPGDGGTWRQQMRADDWPALLPYLGNIGRFIGETAAEMMPWLLLALPAMSAQWRHRRGIADRVARAMTFYALGCTALLVFWPHAESRYAMPALCGVAVLAGLGGAALWQHGPKRTGQAVILLLLVALLVRIGWLIAIPFEAERNRAAIALADGYAAPIGGSIDPIFVLGPQIDYNANFYLQQRGYAPRLIFSVADIRGPAWLITAVPPPAGAEEKGQIADRKGVLYRIYRIEAGS